MIIRHRSQKDLTSHSAAKQHSIMKALNIYKKRLSGLQTSIDLKMISSPSSRFSKKENLLDGELLKYTNTNEPTKNKLQPLMMIGMLMGIAVCRKKRWVVADAVFIIIILGRFLNGFFSQHRAVHLVRWQTI